MGNMKTCTRCDQAKPLDQFYPKRAQCKTCYNGSARLCVCGDKVSRGATQCRPCQSRTAQVLATAARAEALRLDRSVWAVRRAKAQTRRWLKDESGKRCPLCAKRVRSKNGARYCSYDCWKTTQVPMGRRRSISRGTRARVFARDGYVCQICNRPTSLIHDPLDDLSPEIDHIVPVYDGGASVFENLRVAHRVCNRDRNLILYSA